MVAPDVYLGLSGQSSPLLQAIDTQSVGSEPWLALTTDKSRLQAQLLIQGLVACPQELVLLSSSLSWSSPGWSCTQVCFLRESKVITSISRLLCPFSSARGENCHPNSPPNSCNWMPLALIEPYAHFWISSRLFQGGKPCWLAKPDP